jgi:hypothetical protein
MSFVTASFLPATPAPCNGNNEVQSHALRAEQGNQTFLRGSASGARKRHPNLPRFACADLRLLRSLHSVSRVGNPPLALAASAGMGQGQGVFVSKHSTAIQNGGTTQ